MAPTFESPGEVNPDGPMNAALLPEPRCPRYHSLDLWRGVACLLVILFHATFYARAGGPPADWPGWAHAALHWGWTGVPMFFVVSGYCIAASIDAARRRDRGIFV